MRALWSALVAWLRRARHREPDEHERAFLDATVPVTWKDSE